MFVSSLTHLSISWLSFIHSLPFCLFFPLQPILLLIYPLLHLTILYMLVFLIRTTCLLSSWPSKCKFCFLPFSSLLSKDDNVIPSRPENKATFLQQWLRHEINTSYHSTWLTASIGAHQADLWRSENKIAPSFLCNTICLVLWKVLGSLYYPRIPP